MAEEHDLTLIAWSSWSLMSRTSSLLRYIFKKLSSFFSFWGPDMDLIM